MRGCLEIEIASLKEELKKHTAKFRSIKEEMKNQNLN